MKVSILALFTVAIFCFCCLIEAKRKKSINLFGRRHHGKKNAASTPAKITPTTIPAKVSQVIASKVSKISSFLSAHPSVHFTATPTITHPIPIVAKANAKVEAIKKHHKRIFHNRTNLKLVYKSVLPMGMKRPDDNVIFEYTDNEEGKTCRCICRMK